MEQQLTKKQKQYLKVEKWLDEHVSHKYNVPFSPGYVGTNIQSWNFSFINNEKEVVLTIDKKTFAHIKNESKHLFQHTFTEPIFSARVVNGVLESSISMTALFHDYLIQQIGDYDGIFDYITYWVGKRTGVILGKSYKYLWVI